MRTTLWTVVLVVALQGMASASTAWAAPKPTTSAIVAGPETAGTRADAIAPRVQASLRPDTERTPVKGPPQALSKSFQSPKPVRIYWFFGGR